MTTQRPLVQGQRFWWWSSTSCWVLPIHSGAFAFPGHPWTNCTPNPPCLLLNAILYQCLSTYWFFRFRKGPKQKLRMFITSNHPSFINICSMGYLLVKQPADCLKISYNLFQHVYFVHVLLEYCLYIYTYIYIYITYTHVFCAVSFNGLWIECFFLHT